MKLVLNLFLILLPVFKFYSQNKNNDRSFLIKKFQGSSPLDTNFRKGIGQNLIALAKQNRDEEDLCANYYLMSKILPKEIGMKYADSISFVKTTSKNSKCFLFINLVKGHINYYQLNYLKALNFFLIAYKKALHNKYWAQLPLINYYIGLIKTQYGDISAIENYNSALDQYNKLKKKYNNKELKGNLLFSIALHYSKNNKNDLALHFNKKAFEFIRPGKGHPNYFKYFLVKGITAYNSKNFKKCNELFEQNDFHFRQFKDLSVYVQSLNYQILNYKAQEKYVKALEKIKLVDSIYKRNNQFVYEVHKAYLNRSQINLLFKDFESYQITAQKILKLDTIIKEQHFDIKNKIQKEINHLNHVVKSRRELSIVENQNNFKILILSTLIISVVLFILYYYLNTKKFFKRKSIPKETLIPQETKNHILKLLDDFIAEKQYLNPNINLNQLAEKFQTNSSYFSNVINQEKGKNFHLFINDLRIEFVIKLLNTQLKFRNYTIIALAEECGFNNSEAFSKAFYKKQGMYPSVYIKQL